MGSKVSTYSRTVREAWGMGIQWYAGIPGG
jgi:hypothetical protein